MLVVACVFIAFALIVALVVPRARPDFPAKRLGVFIGLVIVLFAAQMTAVFLLAELGEDEPEAAEGPGNEPPPAEPAPSEPAPGEPPPAEPAPGEPPPPGSQGDAAAGKGVFVTNCGACHTFADAGTTGTVGPDLDTLAPSFDAAVEQVTNGGGAMPPFKDSLSEKQIQDVAAYVSSAAQG